MNFGALIVVTHHKMGGVVNTLASQPLQPELYPQDRQWLNVLG